jgi:arylsulfatase A-like enzyme
MHRPNILMVTCHDLGQHLGCYGVDSVQTDNLDKLASQGVRFENFYSTSAVCSPGRGSLHTGRYPHQWSDGANTCAMVLGTERHGTSFRQDSQRSRV